MPLAKNRKTGWVTADDPNPSGATLRRGAIIQTGWPGAAPDVLPPVEETTKKLAQENSAVARRLQQAAANRSRTQRTKLRPKFYRIYGVEQPLLVDRGGARSWYSPTCQLANCRQKYFDTEDAFVAHVLEVHGSPEKDADWYAVQHAATEPPAESDEDQEELTTEEEGDAPE